MSVPIINLESDVLAAQRGSHEAFSRLVRAYDKMVTSLIISIVRDFQMSEDVAQDVFLSAWKDLSKLRKPASFLPWLRQMARNHAKKAVKEKIRDRERGAQPLEEEHLEAVTGVSNPDAALLTKEEYQLFLDVFEELSTDDREIMTLYYREGRSVKQVANLLDLQAAAVKKRMERARNSMKESVLARFAKVVQATAPGAAFCTAVMLALPTASKAATSTGVAMGTKAIASKSIMGGFLAGALGLFLGLWGVNYDYKNSLSHAKDDLEKKQLRLLAILSGLIVLILIPTFCLCAIYKSPVALVSGWVIAMTFHMALHLFWHPRIIARREAMEREQDPNAIHRHRKARKARILLILFGVFGGTVGVLYAVWVLLSLT